MFPLGKNHSFKKSLKSLGERVHNLTIALPGITPTGRYTCTTNEKDTKTKFRTCSKTTTKPYIDGSKRNLVSFLLSMKMFENIF